MTWPIYNPCLGLLIHNPRCPGPAGPVAGCMLLVKCLELSNMSSLRYHSVPSIEANH